MMSRLSQFSPGCPCCAGCSRYFADDFSSSGVDTSKWTVHSGTWTQSGNTLATSDSDARLDCLTPLPAAPYMVAVNFMNWSGSTYRLFLGATDTYLDITGDTDDLETVIVRYVTPSGTTSWPRIPFSTLGGFAAILVVYVFVGTASITVEFLPSTAAGSLATYTESVVISSGTFFGIGTGTLYFGIETHWYGYIGAGGIIPYLSITNGCYPQDASCFNCSNNDCWALKLEVSGIVPGTDAGLMACDDDSRGSGPLPLQGDFATVVNNTNRTYSVRYCGFNYVPVTSCKWSFGESSSIGGTGYSYHCADNTWFIVANNFCGAFVVGAYLYGAGTTIDIASMAWSVPGETYPTYTVAAGQASLVVWLQHFQDPWLTSWYTDIFFRLDYDVADCQTISGTANFWFQQAAQFTFVPPASAAIAPIFDASSASVVVSCGLSNPFNPGFGGGFGNGGGMPFAMVKPTKTKTTRKLSHTLPRRKHCNC